MTLPRPEDPDTARLRELPLKLLLQDILLVILGTVDQSKKQSYFTVFLLYDEKQVPHSAGVCEHEKEKQRE